MTRAVGGASSFMSDGTSNFAISYLGSFDMGAVPEPSTVLLIGCASVGAWIGDAAKAAKACWHHIHKIRPHTGFCFRF